MTRLMGYLCRGLPIACVVLVLALAGCVSEQQYRTDSQPQPYDSKGTNNNPRAGIEIGPNYTVGYVEFDDQGWPYGTNKTSNQSQIDIVTDRVREELATNGLLIVTFVHGWKHNASAQDSNVAMFHQVLGRLSSMERHLHTNSAAPRVFGVYVGWRGLSTDLEPFEELSFWGRKAVAEQVGHGALIELLTRLETERNEANCSHPSGTNRAATKLIIVGHSFGGDIVYSAVAPVLTERMIENRDASGNTLSPKTLGDLVVLINPAFEAARFETVWRLGASGGFPAGTNCTLAVFTSTADWATGLAFPAGRAASTLFDAYQDHQQHKANVDAVGHFAPFINYDLKYVGKTPGQKPQVDATNIVSSHESAEQVRRLRGQLRATARQAVVTTNDLVYSFSRCELDPRANCRRDDPIFNVAVDPKLIPDHDTIDRPQFLWFLGEFLAAFSSSGN